MVACLEAERIATCRWVWVTKWTGGWWCPGSKMIHGMTGAGMSGRWNNKLRWITVNVKWVWILLIVVTWIRAAYCVCLCVCWCVFVEWRKRMREKISILSGGNNLHRWENKCANVNSWPHVHTVTDTQWPIHQGLWSLETPLSQPNTHTHTQTDLQTHTVYAETLRNT